MKIHLKSPFVRYGILAVVAIIVFVLGTQLGAFLTQRARQTAHDEQLESNAGTNTSGAALIESPQQVTDFTLTSHTGDPLSLSDLRGRVVVMFFGYTHCPDVCPNTLANYTQVKAALGDKADQVAFVFVSVDGARDTPDILADYLGRFDEDFIGLTGDVEELRRIGQEYGLVVDVERIDVEHEHEDEQEHEHDLDDANYFVNHTSPSFMIDQDGYLNRVFFYDTDPDVMVSNLNLFLDES